MNRLRHQIFVLVLIVASSAAIIILLTTWLAASSYVQQRIQEDMERAVTLFQRLLDERNQQLMASSAILTADFGFKQAVATRDVATIRSALINHGERIQADLMLLSDLEGRLLASDRDAAPSDWHPPSADTRSLVLRSAGLSRFAVLDSQLYQLILIPVRAPAPIGFAVIGFRFDQAFEQGMRQLTGLEVTFLREQAEQEAWISGSLPPRDRQEALNAPAELMERFRFPYTEHQRYVSTRKLLESVAGMPIEMVLTASLDTAYR